MMTYEVSEERIIELDISTSSIIKIFQFLPVSFRKIIEEVLLVRVDLVVPRMFSMSEMVPFGSGESQFDVWYLVRLDNRFEVFEFGSVHRFLSNELAFALHSVSRFLRVRFKESFDIGDVPDHFRFRQNFVLRRRRQAKEKYSHLEDLSRRVGDDDHSSQVVVETI